MMIAFSFFTILLVTVSSYSRNTCNNEISEMFGYIQAGSYDRMEFQRRIEMYAIDNNLQRGNKALKEVIKDLGASIDVKDDMPLQTIVIRYQKHLHDRTEKRFSQMLGEEVYPIRRSMYNLERESEQGFKNLKQNFIDITHTLVREALEPLMAKIDILDQKITHMQIDMTRHIKPYDCSDIGKLGERRSGVYSIYPQGTAVSVYCDMTTDGGGWTVFLKRHKQHIQENFRRNWTGYRNGFGSPPNEYWLGNEILSVMTNQRDYAMRTDYAGPGNPAKVWGGFSHFKVANETSKYQLSIAGRNGGDTMDIVKSGFSRFNNRHFSTYEKDNAQYSGTKCPRSLGGFWHNDCGNHFPTDTYEHMQFRYWSKIDRNNRHPTEVEMKIRPKNWHE